MWEKEDISEKDHKSRIKSSPPSLSHVIDGCPSKYWSSIKWTSQLCFVTMKPHFFCLWALVIIYLCSLNLNKIMSSVILMVIISHILCPKEPSWLELLLCIPLLMQPGSHHFTFIQINQWSHNHPHNFLCAKDRETWNTLSSEEYLATSDIFQLSLQKKHHKN